MVEKENRRIIVEQAIDLGLIPISAIIPPYAVGLLRIVLKLWYYYHSKEKPQSEENEFLERLADEKLNRIKHISTVTYQYVFDKIHSDDEGHYNDYSSEEYLDALYKTHKFLIDKALEDEANKKDEVYSKYLGYLIFHQDKNWEDQRTRISLLHKLTYRQLVLLNLIVNDFSCVSKESTITNDNIVSELADLKNYGMWSMSGSIVNQDFPNTQYVGFIIKTQRADELYEQFSLKDIIIESEVNDVLKQMRLRNDIPAPHLMYWAEDGNFSETIED